MAQETESTINKDPAKRVRFHYIKSNLFRVIHVDGAYGGITPSGDIHCAVYSERGAIPQVTEHLVTETGFLEDQQVVLEGKAGLVRELDADLVLSLAAAGELRDWLTKRIDELSASLAKKDKK